MSNDDSFSRDSTFKTSKKKSWFKKGHKNRVSEFNLTEAIACVKRASASVSNLSSIGETFEPKKRNTIFSNGRLESLSGKSTSYILDKQLGEGAYSFVYQAYSKITKNTVAIKKIKTELNEGQSGAALREIALLRKLRHSNIVRMLDVIIDVKDQISIVMEYLPLDLKKLNKLVRYKYTRNDIMVMTMQMFRAIEFCHRNKILHRDLKPENILVTKTGELRITDFGLSKDISLPLQNDYSSYVVTLWYRSPDVLLGSTFYDYSIDIWSLGCIFAEFLFRKILFQGKNERDQLQKIANVFFAFNKQRIGHTFDESNMPLINKYAKVHRLQSVFRFRKYDFFAEISSVLDFAVVDFLKRMLDYDPAKRITALQGIKHRYFYNINSAINIPSIPPEESLLDHGLTLDFVESIKKL